MRGRDEDPGVAVERGADGVAAPDLREDVVGHAVVDLLPRTSDLVVVVERARSRIEPLQHANFDWIGDEIERDVRALERGSGLRSELRARADSRPDDGERASTCGRAQTRTSTQQGPMVTCAGAGVPPRRHTTTPRRSLSCLDRLLQHGEVTRLAQDAPCALPQALAQPFRLEQRCDMRRSSQNLEYRSGLSSSYGPPRTAACSSRPAPALGRKSAERGRQFVCHR